MAWINDDVKTIRDLLEKEWSLDISEIPKFYYDWNGMARNNHPGSIMVLSLGRTESRQGINYDSYRVTHRLSVDCQNPVNRERHFEWLNEIYRILHEFRRAGKYRLLGWDYMDITGWNQKSGYTSYYHSILELSLVREVKGMRSSGFGDAPIIPCDECKDISIEEHTEEQIQ